MRCLRVVKKTEGHFAMEYFSISNRPAVLLHSRRHQHGFAILTETAQLKTAHITKEFQIPNEAFRPNQILLHEQKYTL